jgi:hypothetical protein
MTIDFADTHVSSSPDELNSKIRQHFACILSENLFHGINLLETLEIATERIG